MNSGTRMAAQTMSFDSNSTSEQWYLGRKLTLLILLVIALALGLVFLFRQKTNFPSLMFNVFADVSIGLVSGLATRVVLRQRHGLIRGLVSAALAVIGLMVVGYFTNGKSGLVLPPVGLVRVDWLDSWNIPLKLPLRLEHSSMNWPALIYMVIAIDTSWIALRAWNQSTARTAETSSVPSRRVRRTPGSSRAIALPNFTFPKIRVRGSNASPRPKIRRKGIERSAISKSKASAAARSNRWSPLRRHKPQVQLAVYEEHKCPYCLTEVSRNDPRGVVECEVCHALHHKDCWDITGSCQVPHLNT
jgi:ribosomal protein L37AE/L43A